MSAPAIIKKQKPKKLIRVNRRKEKYLKRQVRRLRLHNPLISAKRRKRDALNKIENMVIETLEKSGNVIY